MGIKKTAGQVQLTKKPAQKGQDWRTRAEEVNAKLVKLNAKTMAPRPR